MIVMAFTQVRRTLEPAARRTHDPLIGGLFAVAAARTRMEPQPTDGLELRLLRLARQFLADLRPAGEASAVGQVSGCSTQNPLGDGKPLAVAGADNVYEAADGAPSLS